MFESLRLEDIDRPSRYIGGEIGQILKDPASVRVHMALAFPDLYEIGMSSTGFQILYHLANQEPAAFCERVFAPAKDMMAELRRVGEPLYGLESKTPLRAMDAVLFSIQYELAITNVVLMLDAAQIARRAEQRAESDPIVLAGGHCASNPEPWAPFFDALIIGDGEEVMLEIVRTLDAHKGASRRERVEALGRLEGLYLPHHFRPRWGARGFDGFDVTPGVEPARRRIVMNLDAVPVPACPTLPNTRLVHDRLAVEVMRGCTRGCRFCQPGMLTRPMRERSVPSLLDIIDAGIAQTGHDELTLLSLSSGDYSQLMPLLTEISRRHTDGHVSVSLPSLRAEAVNAQVFEKIGAVRKSGFTIAPEAGTERLRRVLNKPITDEQIFEACRAVNSRGWYLAKLYFMVGLPTETPDDLDAIVDLCFRVLSIMRGHGQSRRAQVNVNVGTFVPKPFTPFAWERQISSDEAFERLTYLQSRTRRTPVRIKSHDARMSYIEGLIGRGDRRVADAAEWVVDHGGGFDGWTEHFSKERWEEAFSAAGIDPIAALGEIDEAAPLPWDGVDALIEKKFLLKERRAARDQGLTDDCRWAKCTACGSCDFDEVKNDLAAEYAPVEFVATPKSDTDPLAPNGDLPQYRYRIRFGKLGPMRHLGHLELAPIIHRVLRRAGVEMAYTQGFNPTPRVAFGPPLASGVQSEDEYMDVVLRRYVDPAQILADVGALVPPGLPIYAVDQIGLREPALFNDIVGVEYSADLEPLFEGGDTDDNALRTALTRFASEPSVPYRIDRKGKFREVDVKELVGDLNWDGARSLRFRLTYRPEGSIRPAQALAVVGGINEQRARRARWTKTKTYFNSVKSPDAS